MQGDLEILSVGSLLVSTNPRLGLHFDPRVNDHVLTIRQVQATLRVRWTNATNLKLSQFLLMFEAKLENKWNGKINWQVSEKDAGAFECQLNTMPSRSLVVHLQVATTPTK